MTSDGEALLRAICENPQEDTPRLAYADWLDENARPERAEFIRLQCEAWALCPAHPTPAAARTRATELLRAHRSLWDAELPAIPGLEWGDMYVRGFIDTVRLLEPRDVTAALERAFAAAPLRFLFVAGVSRTQFRDLLALPHLNRLAKLYLPGTAGAEEARLVAATQKRFPNLTIE